MNVSKYIIGLYHVSYFPAEIAILFLLTYRKLNLYTAVVLYSSYS